MSGSIEGKPYFNSELANEGVLNEAVREKRFADAVLGAWALTEVQVDGIFQVAMGIFDPKNDKRITIVSKYGLQFGEKLRFAKETGAITEEEYRKIDRFNTLRNALLHTKGKGPAWFFTINEKEKEEVIQSAWESARSCLIALVRLTEEYQASLGHLSS